MFGLFKKYEVHLSPEVKGEVRQEGKAVHGLPVFRELFYDDKRYEDKTRTDRDGRFYFPEKNIKSNAPGRMFDESRVVQVITVDSDGKTFLLWHVSTDNIGRRRALENKLTSLNCDLVDPQITHSFTIHEHPDFQHHIGSICRWR